MRDTYINTSTNGSGIVSNSLSAYNRSFRFSLVMELRRQRGNTGSELARYLSYHAQGSYIYTVDLITVNLIT